MVEGYDSWAGTPNWSTGVDCLVEQPAIPIGGQAAHRGMKAGLNGTINLSVLDGWWGRKVYDGKKWLGDQAGFRLPLSEEAPYP